VTPQEQELIDYSDKIIDLVFVVDNTGSMSGEINVAKDTIHTLISSLHEHFQSHIRFSSISYRDHTDDYCVKQNAFTRDVQVARQYINEMSAHGGGDYPEALASALSVLSEMQFNKRGKKIVVWIADAPPHGMGASGDNYPEGCKDATGQVIDWIKIADVLREKGVTCYSLVCERSKNDQQLTLFLDYLAQKTTGKCMLLTNANKIPNLIINGCIEDDEMDRLISQKIQELGEERVKQMKQEELVQHIHSTTQNAQVRQVQAYQINSTNTAQLMGFGSVAQVSKDVYQNGANVVSNFGAATTTASNFGGFSFGAPSTAQVTKACQRFNFK